jgi:hypothetical protein
MLPCAEGASRAGAERPVCGAGPAGALTEMACDIRTHVAGLAPGAVVIGIDATAPPSLGPPGIAVRLAVRVALALGGSAVSWPYTETDEHARAFRHGSRPLVLVRTRLVGERLAADAEMIGPEPASGGHGAALGRASAQRFADAEVRSFWAPVRLAANTLLPLKGSDPDVLALACADPNHEGGLTLATLSRARVTVGTFSDARYELVKSRRLAELAPVAPAPLREPFASVAFAARGELSIGISDRASALRLDAGLAKVEPLPDVRLPWPGGGCSRFDELAVAPRVERCTKGEPALAEPALREPLDAIAGANVTARSGRVRLVRAGRRASDGSVAMTDGEREVQLEHAGAELAVGDLDGDGEPELVTSVDTSEPSQDAVLVYAWRGNALEEKLRVAVPTGVRALAVCPQGPSAIAPIVVATSGAVWVIR